MNTYPVGAEVSVAFPLAGLIPTGLSYAIQHESGTPLLASQSLPVTPGMTEVVVQVPRSLNSAIANPVEARVVTLTVETATGSVEMERIYLIARTRRLMTMENSFQTLAEAMSLGSTIPNLNGWAGASESDLSNAMIEAFLRMRRLGYFIRRGDHDLDAQALLEPRHTQQIEPYDWPLVTKEVWDSNRYPERFKQAMRRAQVLEANEILRGDRVAEKRRAGIMSESIGESSMMFRMDRPLDLGLCDAALRCLAGYVNVRITLTRS